MAGRERLGRTGMREAGMVDRRAGGSAGQVGARQGRKSGAMGVDRHICSIDMKTPLSIA